MTARSKRPTRSKRPKRKESFAAGVGRGLRKAALTARKIARMHGTPIYVWENGKVVAKDPNKESLNKRIFKPHSRRRKMLGISRHHR